MIKNLLCGVHDAQRSGHRPRVWSGISLTAMAVLIAAFVALSGCDKPPTFSELINGKKKEAPATTPPPVAKSSAPAVAPKSAPQAPEKPKRAPQEVIAEFNSTPPERRTDGQIVELASSPEAADQFTELYLTSSAVSDAGMAVFPKFEKVEKLTIDNCQYSNNALANIAKMKGLTSLSMNGGVIRDKTGNCDAGLGAIKEMHQLTSLSLDGAAITPEGLQHIAEMVWLESLSVAHTRFNDDNLKVLKPLINLKELNISFTTVSDSAFEYLLPFHEMETLKIARLPIRGEGLKELGHRKAMPKLRNLVMFSNIGLETSGYEGIYAYKQTLESLDIGQAALTDDRFIHAILPCTKLEVLLVHDNPGISDGGMMQIYRLKKLKRLYFYKNPGISDASLQQFAKMRSLESLTMNATSITEDGARKLKKRLRNCDITYNDKKIE